MFDGPTTPGLRLDGRAVVLDLSRCSDSAALGLVMTCASAWQRAMVAKLHATRRARRRAAGQGHQRLRRGVARTRDPGRRRVAAGVVQALAPRRRPERRRDAPALRPRRRRRGRQPRARARRGPPARRVDARHLPAGRRTTSRAPARCSGCPRSRPNCCRSSTTASGCGRWAPAASSSSTASEHRDAARRHRRRDARRHARTGLTCSRANRDAPARGRPGRASLRRARGRGHLGVGLGDGRRGSSFGDGSARAAVSPTRSAPPRRLPHHLGDPRLAFAEPARSGLPGAAGLVDRRRPWSRRPAPRSSRVRDRRVLLGRRSHTRQPRWASTATCAALRSARPEPGRLTLGRRGRRLLAAEARPVGARRSRRPRPARPPASRSRHILEWEGPVLATSVKTDLLRDTIEARERVGDGPAVRPGRRDAGLTARAGRRSTAARTGRSPGGPPPGSPKAPRPARSALTDADFWYAAAAKLLAPMLFAAANAGATMADVVDVARHPGRERSSWSSSRRSARPAAINAMQASVMRDERQRSSVYTTAETILEAYADPRVLARSGESDIDPQAFLDGGRHTALPQLDGQRAASTAPGVRRADPSRSSRRPTSEPQRPASRSTHPCCIVLDEAANIAPLPDLDVLASTGRRAGRAAADGAAGPRPGARPLGPRPGRHDRQQPPRQGHRRRDL